MLPLYDRRHRRPRPKGPLGFAWARLGEGHKRAWYPVLITEPPAAAALEEDDAQTESDDDEDADNNDDTEDDDDDKGNYT